MTNCNSAVATPNATESNNAVATASNEQEKNKKEMIVFDFDLPEKGEEKKYDNKGAYETLQTMMKSKEQLCYSRC